MFFGVGGGFVWGFLVYVVVVEDVYVDGVIWGVWCCDCGGGVGDYFE